MPLKSLPRYKPHATSCRFRKDGRDLSFRIVSSTPTNGAAAAGRVYTLVLGAAGGAAQAKPGSKPKKPAEKKAADAGARRA